MKQIVPVSLKLLPLAWCLALLPAALGAAPAGTIAFNTRVVGTVDAKVSRPDGTGAGAGAQAQLVLIGNDGTQTPISPTTTFRSDSDAAAYYVNPITLEVPGHAASQKVTLRMRAWVGGSFETAALRGESREFSVLLGGGLMPPANLEGLTGFQLAPSTVGGTITVKAAAGLNGSITPGGTLIKNIGASISFTATANSGFTVDQWSVNGRTVQTGGARFSLTNVQEDRSVLVTFKRATLPPPPTTFSVSAAAGANGSIDPAGRMTIAAGKEIAFTARPDRGYVVEGWLVNNSVVQRGGTSFLLANIGANQSVLVTFKKEPAPAVGSILFNTHVSGVVEAKVSRPDGTGAGDGARAQLFLVGAENRLTPLLPVTDFRTSSAEAAFYVQAATVPVPGTAPGQEVRVRMRAWIGDSYEAARLRGQSGDIAIKLGGGILPPANLIGLEGFTLSAPSSISIPMIVEQPRSVTAHPGSSASFQVKATGGGPLQYQWQRNGVAIKGATGARLEIRQVSADDAGSYSAVVSNEAGSTTSASARLTLKRKRTADDFGNDGHSSILLIHADRTLAFWLMNGIKIRSGVTPYKLADGWEIVGTGDFNNDGKTDVLLRHKDRSLAFWFMDGTTITAGVVPIRLPEGWEVAATGDFNNDGQTDILVQGEDGSLAFWLMNGTEVSQAVVAEFKLPKGWKIVGTGDFNKDGETDILLRHSDRAVAFWMMEGTTIKQGLVPMRVPEGWQIIGLGDFNHDGQTDIMLRHNDRWIAFWFMEGTSISSGVIPLKEPEGWQIIGRR